MAGRRGGPFSEAYLGLVNLDKPLDWTSAKAVTAVRETLGGRAVRVGHAGTLDPKATGVLVLLVGRATHLSEMLMDAGKEYLADVRLGAVSTTDDAEGDISDCGFRVSDCGPPGRRRVLETLAQFIGGIQQKPPRHSALKIDGKRAYHLARRGKLAEPVARQVNVHAIEFLDYDWPKLRLRIECGRGTYIRSLARDIGEALGAGGYLAGLKRTRVGPFRVDEAMAASACRAANVADWLWPVERALVGLPRADLTEQQVDLLAHGRILELATNDNLQPLAALERPADQPAAHAVAYSPAGLAVAVCTIRAGHLRPLHVLRPRQGRA